MLWSFIYYVIQHLSVILKKMCVQIHTQKYEHKISLKQLNYSKNVKKAPYVSASSLQRIMPVVIKFIPEELNMGK